MDKTRKDRNKKGNNLHVSTTTAGQLFDFVVDSFKRESDVSSAKMFGATGLRKGAKFFAMLYKGNLVVKLPAERVEELVKSKKGKPFDPGHGRIMKEWVAIEPSGNKQEWLALAQEASRFVASRRQD